MHVSLFLVILLLGKVSTAATTSSIEDDIFKSCSADDENEFHQCTTAQRKDTLDLMRHSHYRDQAVFDDNNNNADESAHILAVATVPGDMAGKFTFAQNEAKHKLLLNESIVVSGGIDQLSILVDLDIKHQVLLRESFSNTKEWGLEPNFYVKVPGPESTIYGVAALLGTIFDQKAIGITHPLTRNDCEILNSNQELSLPEDVHPYFTVSSNTTISRDKAIQIMQHVCNSFPNMSGQLSTLGTAIEFHDFGSSSNCTCAEIEQALENEEFRQQTFQVTENFANSSLLEKSEYNHALNKSGIQISQVVNCMKLVRKHAIYFRHVEF